MPYGSGPATTAVFERRYQRIALFGGVYSNFWALRALLEDAGRRGAELILCLGDLGGFGPHPQRIVPLLQQAQIPTLAGNYDLSLAHGLEDCGCGYSDPMDNYYAQISYAYTFANTPAEQRAWLGGLPQQARLKLGRFVVHCCHGSPRRTNEFLWESGTSDAVLVGFLERCDADLLAFTHTGIKWQRQLGRNGRGGHAVNVGVIGRPENDGRVDVWYTLLTAASQLQVEFVSLSYDQQRLAAEMRAEHLPEEFVDTVLTGWWTTCLEVLPSKERLRGRY
ncbi:MAG: metallophosphoesterase family protein [Acidobacteriota bacterium]